jgi:type IV pilus biogenesis protein CpaD/CtpE
MKFKQMSLTLAAALAFGLVGCNKNEPAALTTDDATRAAEAVKTAEAAKAEAAKAADTGKTQGLIDKAKGLIAESKFSEASTVLEQLTGQSLSGEQTKLVDALKEQIEKGLIAKTTENAAGIGGDLLKK